jgi:uncharacterized protein (TIGR04255 family)
VLVHKEASVTLIPSPLAIAAAEVRLPYTPALGTSEGFAAVQRNLVSLTFPRKQPDGVFTLSNRELTTQVTWSDSAVTVSTTDYKGFDDFSGLLEAALTAVTEVSEPPAVERIGLRFINELRPPLEGPALRQWMEWLNPAVLSFADGVADAASSLDADLTGFQTAFSVATGEQHSVAVRIQAINGPPVVGSSPLRRTLAENGPFVLLDLDGHWDGATSKDPFNPSDVLHSVSRLHQTIEEIFLWATTSELRKLAGL